MNGDRYISQRNVPGTNFIKSLQLGLIYVLLLLDRQRQYTVQVLGCPLEELEIFIAD